MMEHLDLPAKFETERLRLQKLRYEDAEEIFYSYASKPEATRFVAWPTHQSISDTRAFLRYAIPAWALGKDYTFTIRLKQNGKLLGSIGVVHDSGVVQFGYVLSPTHWGNGFATEACRALLMQLARLPLKRIQTFVDCENLLSIRVLEKSGMKEELRMKDWFHFVNQNRSKDCIRYYYPLNR